MTELKQCEFFLLRYQPDSLTGEFANIGIVLLEGGGAPSPVTAAAGTHGVDAAQPPAAVRHDVHVRFTRDWRRVRCLDPDADLDVLQELENDLREQFTAGPLSGELLVSRLQDYCSNALQLTPVTACLAEDPAREVETLARLYLERPLHGSSARVSGRQAIVARMKDAFEQAGVWGRMLKRIAAADYTFAGDPLKIDCGYTVDGPQLTAHGQGSENTSLLSLVEEPLVLPAVSGRPSAVDSVHLFHAVSLASDLDTAKVLAFSFPQLREGIARKERRRAELTAITEDGLDLNDPAVAFALATLKRSEIAVAAARDLPRIAERARDDLGS